MNNNQQKHGLIIVGRRLTAARKAAGYAEAQQFAWDLGITPQRYRRYERGEVMMPLQVLRTVCALTNKTSDWILFGKSDDGNTSEYTDVG